MKENLQNKIEQYFREEEDIIFAGLYTSQGDFMYSTSQMEISNSISDDTFSILRDIDGYAFEDDSLQDLMRESRNEITLIKKVYFKDKPTSKMTVSFLILCASPDTTFGALMLKMNKFEKAISS
jgi:hypothetical protein